MNVLVIGGTSFFGKDIVDIALNRGHRVTVFSRGNQRPDFWDKVEHILGDRSDQSDFEAKLKGQEYDAVIDNVAYSRNHVESALKAMWGNIGRYVLTSSVAVYFNIPRFRLPVRETDVDFCATEDPQPGIGSLSTYAAGKIGAEKALCEQTSVEYTIIRPPLVMGPEDGVNRIQFYYQRILDGEPLILANGGVQALQPIYRRDLALSYLLAIESPSAVNQSYTVAGTSVFRLVDWLELSAEYLGARLNNIDIPMPVIENAGFEYAEPRTYRVPLFCDVSKAVAELGFSQTPVEEWTRRTAEWYLSSTHEKDSPGYADRDREVELANRYVELTSSLLSNSQES